MFSRTLHRAVGALSAVTVFTVLPALLAPAHAADAWKPTKPVRLLVGFAPGGSADTLARLLADPLSKRLGQSVVVENLAGAGGNIMAYRLSQSAADGYTIGIAAAGSMAITHVLNPKGTNYKPSDFTPITLAAVQPNVVIVNKDVPANNLAELKAYFQKTPTATYGTAGVGISNHLIAETMLYKLGVKVPHAAYRGAAPVITDLLGGHIAMTMDNISTAAPLASQGKVKAIAVASLKRAPQLPNVPTLDEQGLKGFDMPTWQGVFAPAGLPADVLAAYYAALQDVLKDPALVEKMAGLGSEPVTEMTPEKTAQFLEKDRQQWADIVKAANISLEQ